MMPPPNLLLALFQCLPSSLSMTPSLMSLLLALPSFFQVFYDIGYHSPFANFPPDDMLDSVSVPVTSFLIILVNPWHCRIDCL
jgi:hypothetical protein